MPGPKVSAVTAELEAYLGLYGGKEVAFWVQRKDDADSGQATFVALHNVIDGLTSFGATLQPWQEQLAAQCSDGEFDAFMHRLANAQVEVMAVPAELLVPLDLVILRPMNGATTTC